MDECVSMSTPMATERLDAVLQGTPTDQMTYRQMIGGLMYLTVSQPDIAFATFVCACYQARLMVKHPKEVKRIFRYIRQSYNMGLWYPNDFEFELIAYSNAYHAGCKDDSEAEYVSLSACCAKVIWMRTKLLDYGYKYNRIPMYCDSKSAIAISCNSVQHSQYQLADLFTKALPKERFEYLVHRIEFIMAQPQRQANVHQDKLCPLNKRYALMDANKKIDLDNLLKELTVTLNDLRTIFQLPQATYNSHEHFVAALKLSEMVLFYINDLGFTLELRSPSNFKTTGLIQPWQILCKMFSRCLTTGVTGFDQPPLQIMQMLYCFVNNIHVDYADLLWEGLHYSLEHPSTLISYPKFTKLIVSHYMTAFSEISRRAHDKYHNLEDDMMVKNIINSGKHKDEVRIKFRGTHRTTSAPRSPNPDVDEGESSAPRKSTVIRLRIPQRRSTRLTPPTPFPTTVEADDIILQDTIQLSLAEQKSHDELEAKQNVQKVEEHLIAKEIEKLVEGAENAENDEVDSTTLRQNDNPNDPSTRLEPMSNKESPKKGKGKHVEESRSTPSPTIIRSPRIHSTIISSDNDKLQELTVHAEKEVQCACLTSTRNHGRVIAQNDAIQQERENLWTEISSQINNAITNHIPSQVDSSVRNYMSGHILLHVSDTPCIPFAVHPRDQDDPYDDAHPEGENDAKRQKTFEHGTYVFGESSSGQDNKSEPGLSTSGNQEQLDNFDFWTDSYATDDDELPTEKVSQELVNEMSQTVDEAKLRKVVNEMLRQRCTSGDEHQYHIDQMQNFLKNDIKESSRPEKIVMSLYKFLAVIFLDDDIEERTSKWVDKYVKKFNPYARYNVEHWKNPHAKIFYIKKQKEPGKPKEVNLNKNDIEDMYMLIVSSKVEDYAKTSLLWSLSVFLRSTMIWERVHDFQLGVESYQQKVNLTTPTTTFPGIEKYKVLYIVSEPVVLEGLKSYNNDVKHGYVTPSFSKEDAEYLQLFKEEIDEWLKHRDQMRRWEMYVNGRPLGSRRERQE
ncbi:hypothetical protein Tco_0680728 [Tanacetum coccineum]|uniref:Reverse transcriptase Ty1/copia-type domain-containing protein n=1 Tax=Tanacetum coccineum TaxID=301880 RepID=A0ABQ4XLM3_9ASTR